jgi:hypothetical protein
MLVFGRNPRRRVVYLHFIAHHLELAHDAYKFRTTAGHKHNTALKTEASDKHSLHLIQWSSTHLSAQPSDDLSGSAQSARQSFRFHTSC